VYRQPAPRRLLSHPPGGRLPLLSAMPAVTFPSDERHCPSASMKLYCLVTEAHGCEKLAQGCYSTAISTSESSSDNTSPVVDDASLGNITTCLTTYRVVRFYCKFILEIKNFKNRSTSVEVKGTKVDRLKRFVCTHTSTALLNDEELR